MRGFAGLLARRQVDAFGHFRTQRRNARPPRLVAQQAVKTLSREALLPAPDTGLGLAGPAHHFVRPDAIGGKQDSLPAKRAFARRCSL